MYPPREHVAFMAPQDVFQQRRQQPPPLVASSTAPAARRYRHGKHHSRYAAPPQRCLEGEEFSTSQYLRSAARNHGPDGLQTRGSAPSRAAALGHHPTGACTLHRNTRPSALPAPASLRTQDVSVLQRCCGTRNRSSATCCRLLLPSGSCDMFGPPALEVLARPRATPCPALRSIDARTSGTSSTSPRWSARL